MTGHDLRAKYLVFWQKKGHIVVPSAPLVPENDPSTLFTSSGMQPLINYFLGEKHPLGQRICDSQKCFRSQDIEEVGDNRHSTFFEMLGNWSFGDYFKKEQLTWFWEFLVQELNFDPNKLYVTVYEGNQNLNISKDNEALEIWSKLFKEAGIDSKAHIFFYGDEKNWWSRSGEPSKMPVGEPGGPDSEVFYDFGGENCHPNCDCGRFLEIGNSVFMQYQKTADSFIDLPQKNIDFGGGLERILAALADNPDIFATDLFWPIITQLEKITQQKYSANQKAFRIIADHVKAATFLAADGVYPGSKEQAYFSRRLLRRAIRYGKELGLETNFLSQLVPIVAKIYGQSYPELNSQIDKIKSIFDIEENKFQQAIDKGLKALEKLDKLTAEAAFAIYETHGFPLELLVEEAGQKKIALEDNLTQKFQTLRQTHASQSKTASAGMFKGGLADQGEITTKYHTATHLLQAALRKILGPTVQQKGSNITAERLRFDFSFKRALTEAEKKELAETINGWITTALPVHKDLMSKEEALNNSQILSFFAHKYPEQVSVYSIGEKDNYISRELCGGPHVSNTSEIGQIKLSKEKSVAAGVRRIYLELS